MNEADNADFEPVGFDGLPFHERYKILAGSIVPRPIALVSTLAANGGVNVAPFSSFMTASVEEGLLAISIGPANDADPLKVKDTLDNIRREGEFVINLVSRDMADQVQLCAAEFPPDESEAVAAGLSTVASAHIRTPRISASRIQFETRLHVTLGLGRSHLVIGRIVAVHARKGIVRDHKVDLAALCPLGRIAGRKYCLIDKVVSA